MRQYAGITLIVAVGLLGVGVTSYTHFVCDAYRAHLEALEWKRANEPDLQPYLDAIHQQTRSGYTRGRIDCDPRWVDSVERRLRVEGYWTRPDHDGIEWSI